MLYVIIGISILFVGIGFLVTEQNAKYLLAGYNTMSEAERKKVDLQAYLPHFKRFHLFLGLSLLLLGVLIHQINRNAGGIFLAVYPLLAYLYFIASSSKYAKGASAAGNKLGFFVLLGTLVFVVALLGYGFRENLLQFDRQSVAFTGTYGEILAPSEIESVELVNQLPGITQRVNGFALGTVNKGYFKTESGEKVKLILNAENPPYLLFTKKNGSKIFFAAREKSGEQLLEEMKKVLPDLGYR